MIYQLILHLLGGQAINLWFHRKISLTTGMEYFTHWGRYVSYNYAVIIIGVHVQIWLMQQLIISDSYQTFTE